MRSGITALGPVVAVAGCLVGCSAPQPSPAQRVDLTQPESLEIMGVVDSWSGLVNRAAAADVVILGEQHDDALGHAVQLALVEAVLDRTKNGAVALEMLERDEQMLVSDYRDGVLDAEDFAKATGSQRWAGAGSWTAWYQPIIDSAISHGAEVIAANAPRRYVRLVRTDGFNAVDALDADRRNMVVVPEPPLGGHYRQRFVELMGDHSDVPDLDIVDAFFRAQSMWDATMADSVVQALKRGCRPVFLLVGRFHSDHEGGTVQCIRRAMPETDLLCISLEPKSQGKFLADIYDIEYSYSDDAPFDQESIVQLLVKASIAFGEPIGPAAQALFDTHGQADVVVFTSGPKANQAAGRPTPAVRWPLR